MIIRSKIDANGRETMVMCVKCSLDDRGICNGTKIALVNDHKHNSWLIYKSTFQMGYKELDKGKEETFELSEFQNWLEKNGYVEDERACREARERVESHDNSRNKSSYE